jgi:Domain of unknown function (DUF4357)
MGKQVRIYLKDGSATGMRHAEITNWTGQALACPRTHFSDLRTWQEVQRPGVYFLFGVDEESGEDAAYVGESEVVGDRIVNHLTGKQFWTELVAFTNKDDNLTKAHVKYLESRLVQISTEAGRYKVVNSSAPTLSALPRADRDAMEEFIASARILLGVLGHKVLEPYVGHKRDSARRERFDGDQPASTEPDQADGSRKVVESPQFVLHINDLSASAVRTDEGVVVLAGSEAAATIRQSLSVGYRNLRDRLVQTGVLAASGTKLRLTRDHLFNSPSQAAAVLVGYSINGRDCWRTSAGQTYAAYEESQQ